MARINANPLKKSTGSDWKCIFICVYAAKLLYLCLKSSSELKT
jgi:hypothetical protein